MSRIAFPFGPNALGQTGAHDYGAPEQIREMLELLIMTMPGERVMRPEFGSPVRQMLFGGDTGLAAQALQAALEASIAQWLGHLLSVIALRTDFDSNEAVLSVDLTYRVTATLQTDRLQLETSVR